jgi:hypothetical protein
MSPPNRALDAAIALARDPTLAAAMRIQPLPLDVKMLLEILASDAEAMKEARKVTGFHQNELVLIAESYVLKVMLFRGASSRRVLGVGSRAERNEIRQNMSYLLSWLHPDKNPSMWHIPFAIRVVAAWRSIDRGHEDGESSTRFTHDSRLPRRLPWIALPIVGRRHRFRLVRGFGHLWLAALIVGTGCILPDSVGLDIARTVFAMSIYPKRPASSERADAVNPASAPSNHWGWSMAYPTMIDKNFSQEFKALILPNFDEGRKRLFSATAIARQCRMPRNPGLAAGATGRGSKHLEACLCS